MKSILEFCQTPRLSLLEMCTSPRLSLIDFIEQSSNSLSLDKHINESQKDLPIFTFVSRKEKNGKVMGFALGFGTPENPMKPEEVKRLVANSKVNYDDPYPKRPEWTFPYVVLGTNPKIAWGDPSKFITIK